jgi:hypothetical protein
MDDNMMTPRSQYFPLLPSSNREMSHEFDALNIEDLLSSTTVLIATRFPDWHV